ncbi:zinc finger MYM-type protein 4-like isoform X2 [Nelusetta ayraudi]|uniref:zinc finger MYM-type protein 4-like isoform X2 n=1 Tax=Nelusetta ayraudi TaxID=303726 RepID=UPI003F6F41E3
MADSEELRQKRLKHDEHLSRVFDEVMGLGDFADSSTGSGTSSKSRGPEDDAKEADKNPPQEEHMTMDKDEEENRKGSRPEGKMDKDLVASSPPRVSSTSSERKPSFTMGLRKRAGPGRCGAAAFDDAVDGMEDDEDWDFPLPVGSTEGNPMGGKRAKSGVGGNSPRGKPVGRRTRRDRDKDEDEEEEEEMTQEREGSTESSTSHSSQELTPDSRQDAAGALEQAEETDGSEDGRRSELAPVEECSAEATPAPPAPITIKDEPIDEGYNAALLPQSSARQIKEELEQQDEELRISSVYSVGGGNAFAPPAMPAALPTQAPATIFIPSQGTVLQAMAPLPVRPSGPVQSSLTALAPVPQRPPPPPIPGSVRCSGCSKILLKGQTAFQRKGSSQLFCSTVCLTGYLPITKNRNCFQCNRDITQPRDMITIPIGNNSYTHFCGQFCLSIFRHKTKQPGNASKLPEKPVERKPEKPAERAVDSQVCSVCKIVNRPIEHEVTHQGRLHKLCSNACFITWRNKWQLAMNCCEGCGLYCNSNSGSCQTLTLDRSQLNFCSPTCISTYKQTSRKVAECPSCHKMAAASSTVMERDQKGKIQLYCSTACVEQSRPSKHALSGAAFPCSQCKALAVPQFHLAMVDGTIRNFCSLVCVTTFRSDGSPESELTNGTSTLKRAGRSAGSGSVPAVPHDSPSSVPHQSHHPSHTAVPPLGNQEQSKARAPAGHLLKEGGSVDPSRLTCHQCIRQFISKPLLLCHQGRISMFCGRVCCEQFKTQKNVSAVCESCKQEKVLFLTITYNQQDVHFCSENCKLLFKREQLSSNKDLLWRPCTYCSGLSLKMLHSHYGGRLEEFCKAYCMSQFTVLYYGMARCDCCRKQGYMTEKLQCLGSVRNFCNMQCVLHYCFVHFEKSQSSSSSNGPTQPNHSSKMNPVIADVVSLANGSAAQPTASTDAALTGSLPTSNVESKNLDHASTQTDAMRVPSSRRRQMKNKSVLCRPFTMDQETSCKLPESSAESAAASSGERERVKVVMVPVPVPVYIPVPLNMYSQHTPVPLTLPLPLPVPLVVPAQEKSVRDAAVQWEPQDKQRDASVSAADERSSDSGGVKSAAEVADLAGADPAAQDRTLAGAGESEEQAAVGTKPEESAGPTDRPTSSTERPTPSSPMMDLETDFPPELLEQKPPAPQRGVKRPREGYSGRKRSRRRTCAPDRSAEAVPDAAKVNPLYGVQAWRSWVLERSKGPTDVAIKEDVLLCDSAELGVALSRFVQEVRRPNGESYGADSVFYLCLGIQQHLFAKGRIENVFTDELYSQFSSKISAMLRHWKPHLLPSGGAASSRILESHLWECKQLGAYSPMVLLNTLLFFCTKHFGFTTPAQHRSVSFANFTRCSRACSRAGKIHYLRHHRRTGAGAAPPSGEKALFSERLRRRQAAEQDSLEMLENVTEPLHCPVRLYEFYLSKCPQSVRERADVFYLQPEPNVHTHSSHWYTPQALESSTLENMLTRILAVRELRSEREAGRDRSSASAGGATGSL